MDTTLNPSEKQARFFETHILGVEATILTLKAVSQDRRGFSVNIRGPFKLAPYEFKKTETVIDTTWGGPQESRGHLHCCWTEVRFARLSRTNQTVQDNIGYKWEISFFATEKAAADFLSEKDLDAKTRNDCRLFWFYLENDDHKAVQHLKEGELVAVA